MKYTIELTENQAKQVQNTLNFLDRYINCNAKLKPIETTNVEDTNEYQIGYKQGVSDSKVKIEQAYKDGYEVGKHDGAKRVKAYEEKKQAKEEDIKVGDIIYSGMTDTKAIIISFDAWDNWNCIDTCGTGFAIDVSKMEFWERIGHIDEVEQLLDKLRGEGK